MQKLQQSPGSGCGKYAILGFGVLWTAISCCTITPIIVGTGGASFATFANDPVAGLITLLAGVGFPLVFGGVFVVIGLVFIVVGLRPIVAGAKVSKPEAAVSNITPRVGEDVTFTYQQSFKSAIEVKRIAFELILRESATYRRGTNTVTVTHDHIIQQYEQPPRRFEGGESINERRLFHISEGAMHSFEANRNKLRWIIKARVEMQGWPDYDEEFGLRVLPETVR